MPEWFLNLDGGILLWLQEAVRNAVLTPLFTLYTHLGDSGLMWIALSVLLLCFKKTRKAGAAGLMALLLSLMFTNGILKHLVERPRPWLTVEGLTPLIAEHDPNSFPSGHTSASFAAASAWCRTLPRRWMGVTAVVLAALMGFSRLYVGVHFPSDVLACSAAGWPACSGNALPLGGDWRRNTKKELYPRRDTALFGKRVKKLTSARPWRRPLPASSSAPRPRPWRRPP